MTSPDKNPSLEWNEREIIDASFSNCNISGYHEHWVKACKWRDSLWVEQMRLKDERIRELEKMLCNHWETIDCTKVPTRFITKRGAEYVLVPPQNEAAMVGIDHGNGD